MAIRKPKPRTPAERQRARRQRAAAILPQVTFDAEHAAALLFLADETGLDYSALIRNLVREEAARRGMTFP
jgi:hypothetical protein